MIQNSLNYSNIPPTISYHHILLSSCKIFPDEPSQPGRPNILDWGPNHCDLSWAPPESDGGSAITHYVIELKVKRPGESVKCISEDKKDNNNNYCNYILYWLGTNFRHLEISYCKYNCNDSKWRLPWFIN